MSATRTSFLRRISESLGRSEVPPAPSARPQPNAVQQEYLRGTSTEKLQEIFVSNSRAVGTTVYECTRQTLNETVITATGELGQGPILFSDDPLWREQLTVEALQHIHGNVRRWDTGLSREENIDFAEAAKIGIAVAQLALAETGTVMVNSSNECGRSVTLLPETTLFVIDREVILPRLTQAMEYLTKQDVPNLPSSINFISGASSTSDIELVRVQGVHGPVRIAYIVVG